jgi:hypothetical protein
VAAYRRSVGLAALAFALAAVAGFVYGLRADFVVIGVLLLAIAAVWAVLWVAARRAPPPANESTLAARTTLARAAWIGGFVLAALLAVAAVVAA